MDTRVLMIFSITEGKSGMHLRGHYDGNEFIPRLGFCQSINDLYQYDYIQVYTVVGMLLHTPKSLFGDLEREFKRQYVRFFGNNEQISLGI